MKRKASSLLAALALLAPALAAAEIHVAVIEGLGGQPEYAEKFGAQREQVAEASASLTSPELVSSLSGEEASREKLLAHFRALAQRMSDEDRALIYLIGHGSFDGETYKFNIPGPDITGDDLAEVLASLPGDNHFMVNTSSTSGATLDMLATEDRVLVTATRSGNERNAPEFGTYFAEALSSEEADLNKNQTISAQEAFDYAQRKVTDFFESSGRLATEHPQLRGDGAERLTVARLNQAAPAAASPELERLLEQRLELDRRIDELQLERDQYSQSDYNRRLQELILESAMINEEIDALQAGEATDAETAP